jgi:hypothetical protein
MTTQTCSSDKCTSGAALSWFPQWNSEPRVIIAVGILAAAAWVLLIVPVLAAGLIRLRRTDPSGHLLSAWISTWIAGVTLLVLTYVAAGSWLDNNGPYVPTEGTPMPSFRPAVSWAELLICAAWLALGAIITWILAEVSPL